MLLGWPYWLPVCKPRWLLLVFAEPGRRVICNVLGSVPLCSWTGCAVNWGSGGSKADRFPLGRTRGADYWGLVGCHTLPRKLLILLEASSTDQSMSQPCQWQPPRLSNPPAGIGSRLWSCSSTFPCSRLWKSPVLFLSVFEALDHILGAFPQPRPALPCCTMPKTSWCFRRVVAWCTVFDAFHFFPVFTWALVFCTVRSGESFISKISLTFSSL